MVKRAAQKVRVALVLFVPSMEIFFRHSVVKSKFVLLKFLCCLLLRKMSLLWYEGI